MADDRIVTFVPCISPPANCYEPAYWFAFQGDRLLVRPAGEVPLAADVTQLGVAPVRQHYMGYL